MVGTKAGKGKGLGTIQKVCMALERELATVIEQSSVVRGEFQDNEASHI